MAGDDILLSICVPTFNRDWMLRRNLAFHLAAFRELGISFEIVVVDDCSTDGTAALMEAYASAPELSAYRRHANAGFLDNYAFAMRRARGRYALFLGDDDLLIPQQVVACLARFEADPGLGMIQAPWMEVDERAGGGDMAPFYRLDREFRFAKGNLAGLADFLLSFHVFPEFMIVRRDVLARAISSACPFIFWAFLYTGRALAHADVLFLPQPFARVTALSDDPRMRQGNKETMYQWDSYRGGVEYIVALALRGSAMPIETRAESTLAINKFMSIREKVALRLLLAAKRWPEAYVLANRITAYEPLPLSLIQLAEISRLAGLSVAAREATTFASAPAIVDPSIDDGVLGLLDPALRARLIRTPDGDDDDAPRGYLRLDPNFPAECRRQDGIFDVNDYIAQFV